MATGAHGNNARERHRPDRAPSVWSRRGPPPSDNQGQYSDREYQGFGGRPLDPWELFEESFRTGPFVGNTRFPLYPFSPLHVMLNDADFWRHGETMSPMVREFVAASPIRLANGWFSGESSGADRNLTDAEFQTVMGKLKKEKYTPKKNSGKGKSKGTQDDDHVCPICLDVFAAKQELLCLPCSHRFHSGCLTPWIKSHGHCPVCRLDLIGRARARDISADPNSAAGSVPMNDVASFVRAMEDTFNRMASNF